MFRYSSSSFYWCHLSYLFVFLRLLMTVHDRCFILTSSQCSFFKPVKGNTNTHTLDLLSLLHHSKVSTSPLCWKESASGCATINSGVAMGTADLCGLASCLGLWLNKQVKSADKDTRWSSQPHLHPQLPPSLLHSASSSGLASPCATSPLLLPYITHPRGIVMLNLPHPAETQNGRSCINTQTPGKRLLTQRAALYRRQSSHPITWDTICNVRVRIRIHSCPNKTERLRAPN